MNKTTLEDVPKYVNNKIPSSCAALATKPIAPNDYASRNFSCSIGCINLPAIKGHTPLNNPLKTQTITTGSCHIRLTDYRTRQYLLHLPLFTALLTSVSAIQPRCRAGGKFGYKPPHSTIQQHSRRINKTSHHGSCQKPNSRRTIPTSTS